MLHGLMVKKYLENNVVFVAFTYVKSNALSDLWEEAGPIE